MKPIGTIAILIAMLACMWSAQAQRMTEMQQHGLTGSVVELDPQQLKQIKRGMSLEEVYEIIDAPPTEIINFQGKVRKDQRGTFVWYKGFNGKHVSLVLKSDAVVSIITNH